VFKMIGPALIKQDLVEAKSNVNKRIEYIKGEINRMDTNIKAGQSKCKDREAEVRAQFFVCAVLLLLAAAAARCCSLLLLLPAAW
jgi:prefoldin beta subunit